MHSPDLRRAKRSLAGIRRNAEELLRTANAVLDLSHIDQPNAEPAPELVELIEVFREVLENLQPLAERKQLRLRLALSPGVPAVLKTNG